MLFFVSEVLLLCSMLLFVSNDLQSYLSRALEQHREHLPYSFQYHVLFLPQCSFSELKCHQIFQNMHGNLVGTPLFFQFNYYCCLKEPHLRVLIISQIKISCVHFYFFAPFKSFMSSVLPFFFHLLKTWCTPIDVLLLTVLSYLQGYSQYEIVVVLCSSKQPKVKGMEDSPCPI